MRHAGSQLNRLMAHNTGDTEVSHGTQFPLSENPHATEIQQRLNMMHIQQSPTPVMQDTHVSIPQSVQYPEQPQIQPVFAEASANQPAPGNAEIDNIRYALERMNTKLQSMGKPGSADTTPAQPQNTQIIQQQNAEIAQQQNALLQQHYDHVVSELLELRKSVSVLAENGKSASDLEAIHQTLNANYRALTEQLERSAASSMDQATFSSALHASHKELAGQIASVRASLHTAVKDSDIHAKTLEASHNDIVKRMDGMQNSLQTAIGNPALYAESINNNYRELGAQFTQLKQAVDGFDSNNNVVQAIDLSSVEKRLEEITRAVFAFSSTDNGINNLERIEARISDMSKKIEALDSHTENIQTDNSGLKRIESQLVDLAQIMGSASPNVDGIAAQINHLSEKLDKLPEVPQSMSSGGEDTALLLQRMDELVTQVNMIEPGHGDSGSSNVVMQQLEQIAGAIDQLSKPASQDTEVQFASLEQQLSNIASQLNAPLVNETSLSPITQRLTGIEEQIGATRDISIELAAKAAEDAVKLTIESLPQNPGSAFAELDPNALLPLSDSLLQLNKTTEVANSTNIEAFGAIKNTLHMMAERLGEIEKGMGDADGINKTAMPASSVPEPVVEESSITSHKTEAVMPPQPEVSSEQSIAAQHTGSDNNELVTSEASQADKKSSTYNPVANLVKAARKRKATEEAKTPATQETVSSELLAEMPEPPMLSSDTTLPEVKTPEMEIAEIPEVPLSPKLNDRDMPLEPGSGGPDLAALVRQANERRKNNTSKVGEASGTDFIAAARRAAQAAAQEAGTIEEEIEKEESKGLLASLPGLFARKKKVIIIAAAFALLIAAATPLALKFFDSKSGQVASVDSSVVTQQSSAAALPVDEAINYDFLSGDAAANDASRSEDEAINYNFLTEDTSTNNASASVDQAINYDFLQEDAPANGNNAAQANELINYDFLKQSSTTGEVGGFNKVTNIDSTTTNSAVFSKKQKLESFNASALTFVSPDLKQAVGNGDPVAMFEVARRYTEGSGTQKNMAEAAIWYERAAGLGYAPAQYIIGNFNEKGIGLETNVAKAATWYELAAKGGNVISMHNLAVLRATPNVVTAEPDMKEALKWFSNAADYGVRDSQVNAGIFHAKGIGTDIDLVQAYKWFSIAAKAGDKDAGSKRDVIADAMQPDQLATAKTLVEDWKPLEAVKAANQIDIPESWKASDKIANLIVGPKMIAKTQFMLSRVGYDAGPSDGIMGKKTRQAITAFQKKAGLPATGRIDQKLLKALEAISI